MNRNQDAVVRDFTDELHVCLRQNRERHLALAYRLLRDRHDAEDAVQDAALRAFVSLPSFRGEAQLSTWVYRLVVNACLMRRRHCRARPAVRSSDWSDPAVAGVGLEAADPHAADPLEVLAARDAAARANDAIAQLPAAFREVARLRLVEEIDTEATARQLGLTPMAIKVRLHRARRHLRDALAERAA